MVERPPQQFRSPEDEIQYLRSEIARHERELLERRPQADESELETVGKQALHEYGTFTPDAVLSAERQPAPDELAGHAELIDVALDPIEEIVAIAEEKGVYAALQTIEKTKSAYTTDEVHRRLIERIKSGVQVQDVKEGAPLWNILHMTLFEVTLPEQADEQNASLQLAELVGMMEQFLSGMQGVGYKKKNEHFVIEIANPEGSGFISFYVAVPNQYIDLFSKQLLSLYPHATLTEQKHDYNIFVNNGAALVSTVHLKKHPIYPLKAADTFGTDPLAMLLNAFSKIEQSGGGASLQLVVKSVPHKYTHTYQEITTRVRDGMPAKEAIRRSTLSGELYSGLREMFATQKKKEDEAVITPETDQSLVELFDRKTASPITEVNIRIAVSARTVDRAKQILTEIESTFNQFEDTKGNYLMFSHPRGSAEHMLLKAFSFREFLPKFTIPLALHEVATVVHFPANGIDSSPEFKQSQAKTAAAPAEIPTEGTLLGMNTHRGSSRDIYITREDRMRHFYIIGQTGTGKTTLMKNMLLQDIQAGHGVCMIDPHGTDIEDILGGIPPEREDDVIYFDPSYMDRVLGLNMLEFDPQKPEQKTFVVNELFSIFQKLYGAVPESMGPMFEQYFRNATMLVLEDPSTGSTLMDISRVLADASYRRAKLAKATNPVVVQFWREIATKAGGEASLENIVPYITSKFDVFTANDFMRPIIGQQTSSFNFRQVMDERKILLVNLSKGRLGEINANLIGMIIVGKILMAALSRVDDSSKSFPDFFLHMDEFQNVSTNSISAILSEARKYKLGLTVAHQFIAQLDEDIKDAVFGNVGNMVAFRTGPEDAQFLEHQFTPTFTATDLMNVPNRNAYARVLANGTPTKPFSIATKPPLDVDFDKVERIKQLSYERYARPRAEVESEITARYQTPRA